MKKMTKMLCALLCGVLLCGAVAVAMPKEDNAAAAAPVRKQIVLEPEKPGTVSLKIGEQIRLSVGSANIGKNQKIKRRNPALVKAATRRDPDPVKVKTKTQAGVS